MKRYTIIAFFVLFVLLSCSVQQKIPAEFPVAMLENIRVEYAKQYDKGQVLYDINCGNCHTIITGRKKIVPDFKDEQLIGYELRVINAKHESSLKEEQINTEELGLIMTFLRYKKKNGLGTN